jgi:hypothetical protein
VSRRTAAAAHPRRWQRGTPRRVRRGLRVGFGFRFSFRAVGQSVFSFVRFSRRRHASERRMRMRTGRRFRTGAARGRGDGEDVDGDKVVGRACFPSLVARDPRRFARNARGSARGRWEDGAVSRVWRRDAPATLARPPFVMVCCVSNLAFSLA